MAPMGRWLEGEFAQSSAQMTGDVRLGIGAEGESGLEIVVYGSHSRQDRVLLTLSPAFLSFFVVLIVIQIVLRVVLFPCAHEFTIIKPIAGSGS